MPADRALHVYFFSCTHEWFVGESEAQALAEWCDQNTIGTEEDIVEARAEAALSCTQCPDDELFEMSPDGGDTFDEKTFTEWAKEHGPGRLAGEL